jgi:hypothetical protein
MICRVLAAVAILTIASISSLQAGTVFSFGSSGSAGAFFDIAPNNSSGTYVDVASGLSITMTANPGNFNQTPSGGFGINQSASGDETSFFDNAETMGPGIAEGFTFSFNQDVQLGDFVVSSLSEGNSDSIDISIGGGSIATVLGADGVIFTSLGTVVDAGTNITVSTTGGSYGNGWSLESIEVTGVPEPTSATLFGLASFGFCFVETVRRRRRS